VKVKPKLKKQKRIFKKNIAIITSFLIMVGAEIIVRMVLLKNAFESLPFYSPSNSLLLLYVLTLAILTFLIYQLNTRIPKSSIAIGLILATVISLPELIYQVNFTFPLSITILTILNDYFSITLASYVFETMTT